jgi:hypothetical protein
LNTYQGAGDLQQVAEARASLQNMLTDFARDVSKKNVTQSTECTLERERMQLLMQTYERFYITHELYVVTAYFFISQVRHPLYNLAFGELVRALLIQVQK